MPDMDEFTDEFVAEWVGKHLNINGAHINFDGRFGTQCMDLWNYWWTELGLTGITRNPDAASVWENHKGTYYQHFDGIFPDQPAKKGDVFIYNRKAWGTGYGHIGIVLEDLGDRIRVFETNGLGDGYEDDYMNQYGSPPRIHVWPKKNLYGYLRYIQEEDDMAKEDIEEIKGNLTKLVKGLLAEHGGPNLKAVELNVEKIFWKVAAIENMTAAEIAEQIPDNLAEDVAKALLAQISNK